MAVCKFVCIAVYLFVCLSAAPQFCRQLRRVCLVGGGCMSFSMSVCISVCLSVLLYVYLCVAPQCGRQLRRVFLVEGGCRSRRRMLQTTCVGNCGRDCCRPRGHRPGRRVTFICNDGTRYKKTVQMARKCRCQRKCPAEPSGLGF